MLLYMTQLDTTAVLLIISLLLIAFSIILFITNTFKHRSFKNKVVTEATEIDKMINENVTSASDTILKPNDWQVLPDKNLFPEVDATIIIPPQSNEHFTVEPGNLVASMNLPIRFTKVSNYLLQSKYSNLGITSSSDPKKTLQEFIDKSKPNFNIRVFYTNKNNKELAKEIGVSESQLSFYFTDRPLKQETIDKIDTYISSNYEYLTKTH